MFGGYQYGRPRATSPVSDKTASEFQTAPLPNFDINGVRILGTTLWTDYNLNGPAPARWHMQQAEMNMNDHRLIRLNDRIFMPRDAKLQHEIALEYLDESMTQANEMGLKTVLMTHHAPLALGNPDHYKGGDLAPAYASDLTKQIESWLPDVWVWGHTHHSVSSEHGVTKLYSSARGYVCREPGADTFRPLVFEV